MIKKQQQFVPKGMNQDIAETKVQSELAHSIKNLRVVTDESDGTLSLVTERGTKLKQINNNFECIIDVNNKRIPITFTKINEYSQYDTLSLTGSNLTYRTHIAIFEFSFNVSSDPNTIDVNCINPEDVLKYISYLDTIKTNINLYSDGVWINLKFNSETLKYSVQDGGYVISDTINFYRYGDQQNPYQILDPVELNLYNLVKVNNTIKVRIPVLWFNYAFNANPSDLSSAITDVSDYIDTIRIPLNFNRTVLKTIGNVLGSCVINNQLVLFTKSNSEDKIIKFNTIEDNSLPTLLYSGNLNFDFNYPIKTFASYENEKTVYVYWIDGLNQPRLINIEERYEINDTNDDNHFDFLVPVYNKESVTITKRGIGGLFHSGVLQYFMTYVDLNNQESKIFYASHLYYLTDNNRALSPEDTSTNSFILDIKNVNANELFRKKLRIYSIHRSSTDSVPTAKLVYEIKLSKETEDLSLIDTGNIGYNVDVQTLLTLGCDEFVPKTFAIKDNIMFFGNIEIKNHQQIDSEIANNFVFENINISNKVVHFDEAVNYSTNFQLSGIKTNLDNANKNGSDNEIKGFMFNEEYMLGVQFLHKSGEWSEPVWCGDFIMSSQPHTENGRHYIPYFRKTLTSLQIIQLRNNGYIAVRPLVVFNDKNNSKVLCQGIINPTIKYKENYYPSWFFRYINSHESSLTEGSISLTDSCLQYINHSTDRKVYGEVQGYDNSFTIKSNFVTFNSPEVEFEKIISINNTDYSFLLTGFAGVYANNYDIELLTSTSVFEGNPDYGVKTKKGTAWYDSTGQSLDSLKTFVGGFCWKDKNFIDTNATGSCKYYIWPWENNQSYSCAPKTDNDIIYSAPERKIISNYRYCKSTNLATKVKTFPVINIGLANNAYLVLNNERYIKDVDILLSDEHPNNCYYIAGSGSTIASHTTDNGNCDIVRIQYKTTPHIVLQLGSSAEGYGVFYTGIDNGWDSYAGTVIVGELLNDAYNENTKFKGRFDGKPTDTSMYENTWYIAGDVQNIRRDSVTINWTKGDTYYQRYDCLKTYPFSHEAPNSIVDVLSCMIQTRINIDGRYDKNRCFDILHIDPTNFNKLNDVYTQYDNFFTYRKLDPDKFSNTFVNLITWSKQKIFGESINSWTNIHLVNTLDLDGNFGEITALKLWNNKLLAFQKKGIALIKYNENVMIPQANGAPIVLMNSGLVNGKEYLTNQFGCQNEWSIVNAKSGLYFSDDFNQKLYVISDGIKCISDNLGFKSYLKTKGYTNIWKPDVVAGKALHTFYDQQLGEIYFTDGEDCLTFNENLNLFTSFYDYKNTFIEVANPSGNPKNLGYYECNDGVYTLTNDTSVVSGKIYYYVTKLFDFINIENKNYWILNNFTNNIPIFYEHRAIDNLNIFGINRDYSIELTSNIDSHLDKIFDTVEIRGDAYINNNLQSGYNIVEGVNTTSLPFDKLQVSNEYQDTGEQELNFIKDKPYSSTSNMKQKFRIWRVAIGRNKKNNQNTRDRIRNYWSRIRLIKNATNNLRAKIHDIIVNVYE